MATLVHPSATEFDLSDVLHALSDPVRRSIVRRLAREGEVPCGGFDLSVSKSTSTHHFRVLRESGVIHQRREGTSRLTELRREDLDARFPGLIGAVLSSESVPA